MALSSIRVCVCPHQFIPPLLRPPGPSAEDIVSNRKVNRGLVIREGWVGGWVIILTYRQANIIALYVVPYVLARVPGPLA